MASDSEDGARLDQLDQRIKVLQERRAEKPKSESKFVKANLAWQMVIELVVGMVIGLGIGWGLDWLLGTLPIFLILFGLLGFGAGIKVMAETAQNMSRPRAEAEDTTGAAGEDKGADHG